MATLDTAAAAGQFSRWQGLLLLLTLASSRSKRSGLLQKSHSTEEPELYEVEIQQPPTREDWISGIREAVDACSYDEGQMLPSSSLEEARRFVDAKYMRLRHLTAELRGKDLDLARTFEDKMRIVGDMLVVAGGRDAIASAAATEDRYSN